MNRVSIEEAYPHIDFAPSSRNWWARLKGSPSECVHLGRESAWIASIVPDTLYLQSKRAFRGETVRPEITVCRDCLIATLKIDLEAYAGKIVAFEPDAQGFSQYFFIGVSDFETAGLTPEVARAIETRVMQDFSHCAECRERGTWLWFSREDVSSLDETDQIIHAPGQFFCRMHGPGRLFEAFEQVQEANLFYVNVPYGEAGTYVWI